MLTKLVTNFYYCTNGLLYQLKNRGETCTALGKVKGDLRHPSSVSSQSVLTLKTFVRDKQPRAQLYRCSQLPHTLTSTCSNDARVFYRILLSSPSEDIGWRRKKTKVIAFPTTFIHKIEHKLCRSTDDLFTHSACFVITLPILFFSYWSVLWYEGHCSFPLIPGDECLVQNSGITFPS